MVAAAVSTYKVKENGDLDQKCSSDAPVVNYLAKGKCGQETMGIRRDGAISADMLEIRKSKTI